MGNGSPEFGLIRGQAPESGLRVYGSGLLSSYGEIQNAIDAPGVQCYPLQLECVVNQGLRIDRYQSLLFIVDSFDHLFREANRLEVWMKEGRLDDVAPGEPVISKEEIRISLDAARG